MANAPKTAPAKKVGKTPEQKQAKFKELANKRVGNALKAVSLIGNLTNRASYDYTQEQVDKIGQALDAEVLSVKAAFKAALEGKAAAKSTGFTL